MALAQRVLPAVAPSGRAQPAVETASDQPPQLVGDTPAMRALFRAIGRLAQAPLAVLITGETGTGKELVAHALHRESPRAHGPFVALNTAAIPAELLESELFGHEAGAFTARSAAIPGASSRPTAARCSWTKSATCRCRCRPACCACWRRASSSASVAAN